MLSRKILSLLIFSIIFFSSITKVYSIEADIFIQSIVNRAAETLSADISKDERIEKLKVIARETVDIDGIGRYTLGSYKNNITDNQMKKYKSLFREYLSMDSRVR